MPRPSNHGATVNHIYREGLRVVQVAPDHELGGCVAWCDLDDTPPQVLFFPIVGWALTEEDDGSGGWSAGILLVTADPRRGMEFWEVDAPAAEGFLGVAPEVGPATVEQFQ